MSARLGLHPRVARALQPIEIAELARGQQDRWSQQALLVAWSTWMICMSIPSFAKRGASDWRSQCKTFDAFVKRFMPPGYVPEEESKARKRVTNGRK